MKEKTALNQLIDQFTELKYIAMNSGDSDSVSRALIYQFTIQNAKDLLELEKKQMGRMFMHGCNYGAELANNNLDHNKVVTSNFETYFTDTYDQPK